MTEEQQLDDFKPGETRRIVKNVIVISVAFMVHFMAFGGAASLQSSINPEAGLGTASLAAVYSGVLFSSIFLPAVIIKWFGTKWTMLLSFITYMPYIVAQLYPRFYTLVPAGVLLGLGGGTLWCAEGTYISVVSDVYSRISKVPSEEVLSRFMGLFYMTFQLSFFGNLISAFLLSSGDNEAAVTPLNATAIPELCGANYRPSTDSEQALQQQPPEMIMMLNGIYLACMVGAAIIIGIGVDSMKRYDSFRINSNAGLSGLELLTDTMKLAVEPYYAMMIIVNIFVGYHQAFFEADFTVAFVSCAVGTGTVGFVMMSYSLTNAIGSIVNGYLVKVTGRVPLVCGASVVLAGLMVVLLVWRVQAGQVAVLYAVAVPWGLCDSVWRVQLIVLGRNLFPGREEAVFANYTLWNSVGSIIGYVLSPYLRTCENIYFMLAMMSVGVILYCVVESKGKSAMLGVRRCNETMEFDETDCNTYFFKE